MNGLDKIVERIAGESAERAEAILSKARDDAEAIAADSASRQKEECEAILKKAEESALSIKERGAASADLRTKQILLAGRQELLTDTIDKARERLNSLSDAEYRDIFIKLFDNNVCAGDATLLINAADRERFADGTLDQLVSMAASKGCTLKVSETDAPIKNGFILDYGGIEENCTFDALFDQNIEALSDRAGSVLFA